VEIGELMRMVAEKDASDLHLKVGSPPCLRVHGILQPTELPVLTPQDTEEMAMSIMNERQKERFYEKAEADFAYSMPGVGRFRINVYRQRGSASLALRRVTFEHPSIEELNLPPVILNLAEEPRGLILVTGTAGSGKTTTLSVMIDHINETRQAHVVTIEDPIEVLHRDKKSVISQREIGIDTDSYADALRHVVRQDPDVILIGEMRDPETVSAALSAAEMGNLVLSTLHTIDATETINRVIDFFPPYQQNQIRIMLASILRGIISMRLLPMIGEGRIPAVEVMVMTATIREFVLKPDETVKIKDAIEQGDYYGMQTFEKSLLSLYKAGKVTIKDAQAAAENAHDFMLKVKQLGLGE
jgi:twitching motility protein PilT